MKALLGRKALVSTTALAGMILGSLGSAAGARQDSAPLKGEGKGLKLIANVPWASGSDMEFTTIKGRDYAFAGSFASVEKGGGLHVIDVTNPEKPKEVAWLKCPVYQNDIQISHDNKTVIMAADSAGGPESCLAVGKKGFMTVDISNPKKPKAVGFAEISRGSHNTTAHPTQPFVYNSDSDLANRGIIEVWSIKNPAKPEKVTELVVPGHSPHDLSFNKKGTMAVTAAISHIDLINTEDPAKPSLKLTMQCPGCSITHDAKFTPDGKGLIVGDEGGGGGGYPCPGGALYFYSLQADTVPVLTGIYEPGEVLFARDDQGGLGGCTAHVFDISDDGKNVAISWYTAGTRYLDVSSPTGATFGEQGAGVKELGWFQPDGGNTWSSKFYKGPYIFSNDINRGFDVFKIGK